MKHTLLFSTALAAILLTACCGPLNPKKPLPNIEEVKKHVEEKVEKIEEKVEQKVEEVEKKVEQVEEKIEEKVEKKIERVFIPLKSRLATQANWHFYQTGEQLDWEHSIVDLLKLVDYDSSFASRRELAQDQFDYNHYRGTKEDNLWLHEQVIGYLDHL